jgi:hypothetical protein
MITKRLLHRCHYGRITVITDTNQVIAGRQFGQQFIQARLATGIDTDIAAISSKTNGRSSANSRRGAGNYNFATFIQEVLLVT